ncbi:MAG: chorismate synthase [Actinomycetia bacterium]|nr:chorismate synthase [Actinomycetes bacterium]
MDVADLLTELYDRIPPRVRHAVEGLTPEQLTTPPAPGANTVGWLVWHLTRVQDHHLAELVTEDQLWVTGDWAGRFGLDPDPQNTGYEHSADDVAAVRPDGAGVLVAYHEAVAQRTGRFLRTLTAGDLDRVVDTRWDPPVTLGVRLVSVADDDLQHVGQAAYARGLLGAVHVSGG